MERNVTFVVGAQYGDEGKGMVAKLLADRAEVVDEAFTWTGRVGAQNAEHRFVHGACDFCARILPSASAYRPDIYAVLGPGHCFNPYQLPLEAVHLGIEPSRVIVDPQAMWLRPDHAESNLSLGNVRGTTGWGIGQALAEKVRRDPETKLVGKCETLREAGFRVESASEFIESTPGRGLMEGSQGAMLSLDHGRYPHCTGKNVTAPALCAEMGFSHRRVERVIGVIRLVFMRVPGPSGPTGGEEVSYDEVEDRTGLRLPQHKRLQGDTTRWAASNKPDQAEEERLFELSMEELHLSHRLNHFDALAVTFADYHRPGNYRMTQWDDLHQDTKEAINTISMDIAPVMLVRTGQGEHDNIWLDSGC